MDFLRNGGQSVDNRNFTHGQRMNLREFTSFSCQLQVSSSRASYFLDAETCDFCASSIVVHGRPWDITFISLL